MLVLYAVYLFHFKFKLMLCVLAFLFTYIISRAFIHSFWFTFLDFLSAVSFCFVIEIYIVGFFFRFYLFISRERGRKGEIHWCVVASCMPPTGDLACNPDLCTDWESNWQPLVHRLALSPMSCTSQGYVVFFRVLHLWYNLRYFSHYTNFCL